MRIKLIILFAISTLSVCGQSVYFDTTYIKGAAQYGIGISAISNNSYFLLGSDLISGDSQVELLKVNRFGEILSSNIFGIHGVIDFAKSIQRLDTNSFLITYRNYDSTKVLLVDTNGIVFSSFSISSSFGASEFGIKSVDNKLYFVTLFGYILKTDLFGNLLWSALLPGIVPECIAATADSGLAYAGYKSSTGKLSYGKFNLSGDSLWTRDLNNFYKGLAIEICNDSGLIIGSYIDPFTGSGEFSAIIRTDSYGDTLWTKYYLTSSGNDQVNHIKQIADGYIFSSNHRYVYFNGLLEKSIILHKIDNQGNLTWFQVIQDATAYSSSSNFLINENNGGYTLFCHRIYPPYFIVKEDYRLIQLDSLGNINTSNQFIENVNNKLICFPNPTRGSFKLMIPKLQLSSGDLIVTDIYSNLVLSKKVNALSLDEEILIPNCRPGVYNVFLYYEKYIYKEKIVIIN